MATLIIATVVTFAVQALIPNEAEGVRYDDITFQGSTYDAAIPVIYAQRMATNIIWASPVRETEAVSHSSSKWGGGTDTVTWQYLVSLACGLGAGPIAAVRRIWINGTVVYDPFVTTDEADIDATVYLGLPDEDADSEMEAYEGTGNVPGYRDLAYVLIKDLDLAVYGGRAMRTESAVADYWAANKRDWSHFFPVAAIGCPLKFPAYRAVARRRREQRDHNKKTAAGQKKVVNFTRTIIPLLNYGD